MLGLFGHSRVHGRPTDGYQPPPVDDLDPYQKRRVAIEAKIDEIRLKYKNRTKLGPTPSHLKAVVSDLVKKLKADKALFTKDDQNNPWMAFKRDFKAWCVDPGFDYKVFDGIETDLKRYALLINQNDVKISSVDGRQNRHVYQQNYLTLVDELNSVLQAAVASYSRDADLWCNLLKQRHQPSLDREQDITREIAKIKQDEAKKEEKRIRELALANLGIKGV